MSTFGGGGLTAKYYTNARLVGRPLVTRVRRVLRPGSHPTPQNSRFMARLYVLTEHLKSYFSIYCFRVVVYSYPSALLLSTSCFLDSSALHADRPFDPPGLGIRSSSRRFEGGFNRGVCRGKMGRIFEGTPLGGVHLHDQHGGGGRSKVIVTSKQTYVRKGVPIIRFFC